MGKPAMISVEDALDAIALAAIDAALEGNNPDVHHGIMLALIRLQQPIARSTPKRRWR